tara:strand:+ start:1237 stop:1461 length:225 start_codon:yes stop_codon:yes gene_type:complete
MKITIESSPSDGLPDGILNPNTVVTIDCHCVTLDDVLRDLVKPALLAWGFHPDNLPPLTEEEMDAYMDAQKNNL